MRSSCVVPAALLDNRYSTNGLELARSFVFTTSCNFSLEGRGNRSAFRTFRTAVAPHADAPIWVTCKFFASCSDHIMVLLTEGSGLMKWGSTVGVGWSTGETSSPLELWCRFIVRTAFEAVVRWDGEQDQGILMCSMILGWVSCDFLFSKLLTTVVLVTFWMTDWFCEGRTTAVGRYFCNNVLQTLLLKLLIIQLHASRNINITGILQLLNRLRQRF